MPTDNLTFSPDTPPVPKFANPVSPVSSEENAGKRGFRDVLSTSLSDDRSSKTGSTADRLSDSSSRTLSPKQSRRTSSKRPVARSDGPRTTTKPKSKISSATKKEAPSSTATEPNSEPADTEPNTESADTTPAEGNNQYTETRAVEGTAPAEFVATLLPAAPQSDSPADPPDSIAALSASNANPGNQQLTESAESQSPATVPGENPAQANEPVNQALPASGLDSLGQNEEQAATTQSDQTSAKTPIETTSGEQRVSAPQVNSKDAEQSAAALDSSRANDNSKQSPQDKVSQKIPSPIATTSGDAGAGADVAQSKTANAGTLQPPAGNGQQAGGENSNGPPSPIVGGNRSQIDLQRSDAGNQTGQSPVASSLEASSTKPQGEGNSGSDGGSEKQQSPAKGTTDTNRPEDPLASTAQTTTGAPASPAPDAQLAASLAPTDAVTPLGPPSTSPQVDQSQSATTGVSSAAGGTPVDVNRANFMDRVAQAVQTSADNRHQITVRLTPPELGTLQIEIAVKNGTVSARLETQTTAARQILTDHLPQLKEALAQNGASVERVEVFLADNSPDDRQGGAGTNFARQDGQGDHPTGESSSQQADVEIAESEKTVRTKTEQRPLVKTAAGNMELDVTI